VFLTFLIASILEAKYSAYLGSVSERTISPYIDNNGVVKI
jgi:hypothetical protein